MPVGIKVGVVFTEIGPEGLLNAFFSTIGHRLESGGWGSKYPLLLGKLYQGRLESYEVHLALDELHKARAELAKLSPDKVLWDIEDVNAQPPWGDDIPSYVTDLSTYFITRSGKDVFDILIGCFRTAIEVDAAVLITYLEEL